MKVGNIIGVVSMIVTVGLVAWLIYESTRPIISEPPVQVDFAPYFPPLPTPVPTPHVVHSTYEINDFVCVAIFEDNVTVHRQCFLKGER